MPLRSRRRHVPSPDARPAPRRHDGPGAAADGAGGGRPGAPHGAEVAGEHAREGDGHCGAGVCGGVAEVFGHGSAQRLAADAGGEGGAGGDVGGGDVGGAEGAGGHDDGDGGDGGEGKGGEGEIELGLEQGRVG